MKWSKEYFGSMSNPRIAYTSGEYRICRTQSKNIWTGRVMSEQVWNIYKDGEKIDWAPTLKEAKALVAGTR
jgi:hypothetical protein